MNRLLILCLITAPLLCFGQSGINYQAVARDQNHNQITNQELDFTAKILYGNEVVFAEDFPAVNTGPLGIINLLIGSGERVFGHLDSIDWRAEPLSLRISVDGSIMGETLISKGPPSVYAQNSGLWKTKGDSVVYLLGPKLGIGTANPTSALDVVGNSINLFGREDSDFNLDTPEDTPGNSEIRFRVAGEEKAFLRFLKNEKTLLLRNVANERTTTLALTDGAAGIGTTRPSAPLHLHTPVKDQGLKITTQGFSQQVRLHLARRSNDTEYAILDMGGGTQIRGNGETSTIKGRLECGELTIQGADIVERFNSPQTLQPGEVVQIDPNHRNRVYRANKAYGKLTIGVVSGAGGVKHAIELKQDGVLDGNVLVAISGRVWVKVTVKVEAGDLLTSSDVPGKAMAANNSRKAFGATIGKALTGVNDQGMVLMLVSVQ